MTQIFAPAPRKITEAMTAPCSGCPFRRDGRREALSCQNFVNIINAWEDGDRQVHTCHLTDPRADGFKPGYDGPVKACAGALALAQKSGLKGFTLSTSTENEALVWSAIEIRQVYRSALRRLRRWDRKKQRILAHLNLREGDAHDCYITDGAVNANVDAKKEFFEKLTHYGFLRRKYALKRPVI